MLEDVGASKVGGFGVGINRVMGIIRVFGRGTVQKGVEGGVVRRGNSRSVFR